jgi:hypothetical protein
MKRTIKLILVSDGSAVFSVYPKTSASLQYPDRPLHQTPMKGITQTLAADVAHDDRAVASAG